MADTSREQFIEQVIQVIRDRFPLVKVARAPSSFSLKLNGHMASLENLYRIAALRPDEMKRQVERWIVEMLRASEGAPDQTGSFEDIKDKIMPMLLSDDQRELDEKAIVSQPLVPGLQVAYAIDHDRTISYLPRTVFEGWVKDAEPASPTDEESLHETAMANLVARSEAINAHAAQDEQGSVYLILFQTMDGYDASRLLLPSLHERLRGYLGSPFAAAVPNRDILLCFRNDEATVEKLREQISNDYRQMPHQVTDKLFLVTQDGIAAR